MTDNQILLIAVIILYLSECVFWVDSSGIAFVKAHKKWRLAFPSVFFGTSKGGLAIAWPFPILGNVYLTYCLPFSLSEQGIVNETLEGIGKSLPNLSGQPKLLRYVDIKSVGHQGNYITINGETFCRCGSNRHASILVSLVQRVAGLGKHMENNSSCINNLFDKIKLVEHDANLQQHTRFLRVFCNYQFLHLLFVSPVLVYFFGTIALIATGIFLITANLILIILYHRTYIKLYNDYKDGHVADILKMVFSPPLAIRALDLLSLQYAVAFHPVVVAHHVLGKQEFKLLAKQMLLSNNHACNVISGEEYKTDLLEHIKSIDSRIRAFLEANGHRVSDLLQPPAQEEGVASYCPRCHAQYVKQVKQCIDCGGIALIEYTRNENG